MWLKIKTKMDLKIKILEEEHQIIKAWLPSIAKCELKVLRSASSLCESSQVHLKQKTTSERKKPNISHRRQHW